MSDILADPLYPLEQQTHALATIIQLTRRARESSSPDELRFLLVNETHALLPYRQAAFWTVAAGVEALSGVTVIEKHGPFVQWLHHWCGQLPAADKVQAFATDLRLLKDEASKGWAEWLAPFVVSVQLPAMKGFAGGRFLLSRDQAFSQAELHFVEEWCAAWLAEYAQRQHPSWQNKLTVFKSTTPARRRWVTAAGLLLLTAALLFPVTLSVLAPADLIPLNPAIVRAPMDGVIDRIVVEPNQRVNTGDVLFEFDRVMLDSQLELARRTLATAKTTYRQNAQQALSNVDSKADLAILRSQIEEKQVEADYLETLNQRSRVTSPQAGLVILNDATQWIGRPVVTGERVMAIANEHEAQVEAWLSPGDMIDFPESASLRLYLSANPLQPVDARVSFISHEPELRPDGNFAYRLRASLDESAAERVRIGLKGTARIQGQQVPLIYWVFRRPLAALRGWLGL